ncbi:hypothetical protein ACO0LM_08590 [Undibacterium sp. Di26W]|uniref:hypothetical protein n=1 Tax=Undibacterium sp. Di26W TaxID=3413035 RepID=UPI003BF20DB1
MDSAASTMAQNHQNAGDLDTYFEIIGSQHNRRFLSLFFDTGENPVVIGLVYFWRNTRAC